MKKLIISVLLIGLLTGCASSASTNKSSASVNEAISLDKAYTISQLSYKVSSTWEYKNIDGANYFYLPDGSMLYVSNSSLGGFSVKGADMQSNMLLAYTGFTQSASNVKAISTDFDSKNNVHTAAFTADFGKGTQYVNYYATVGDKYLYCIVLIGDTNSQDKLDKLFKEVISNVTMEDGAQASVGIALTKYEIIKTMDGRLKENNFPTFSNASKTKTTENIAGLGDVTLEVYGLTNGMFFGFYSDIKTGELLQLAYVVDRNKLSAGAYQALGFVNVSLPYLFEKDTYKDLDKKLGMNSDKKTFEAEAAGTERQYYYLKADNLSSLYVYPVGEEILVRAQETTPSPSAGAPETASPSSSTAPSENSTPQTTACVAAKTKYLS